MTGTPLIIRNKTRLLNFYKEYGVVSFDDFELENKVKYSFDNYDKLKTESLLNINKLSMDNICKMNFDIWSKN